MRKFLALFMAIPLLLVPTTASSHTYSCSGSIQQAMVRIFDQEFWTGPGATKCFSDYDLLDGYGTSENNWSNKAESMVVVGDETNRYICLYNFSGYDLLIAQYSVDAHEHLHIDIPDNTVGSILQTTGQCPSAP
jgi:hypothetical protein